MFSVMMALILGVASQPAEVTPPPPLVNMMPMPRVAPQPLPDGPAPATRAKSSSSLPSLFSTDDYPSAALRNGEEGTVAFAVSINRDGRVTECSIAKSSGSASLDSATCSIIMRRARFSPARDEAGRTVEDRTTGRVRWVLPPQPLIGFTDLSMAFVFTIDAAGGVTNCRVESSIKQPGLDRMCPAMMNNAKSIAADAAKIIAITNRELVLEQGVRVGGPDSARNVGRGPGETRGMLFALVLDIDAAGTITRCVAADETLNRQLVDRRCRDSVRTKVVPLDTAANDQSERHAVRYWATYTRPID